MNFKRYVEASDTWVDSHYIMSTSTDTITTPADIYANDTTATVGLKGQMEQSGTPMPTTPIQPQETGERTGNLFDKSKRTDNYRVVYTTGEVGALNGIFVSDFTPIEPNATYTLSIVSSISGKTRHLFALYDENKNFVNTGAHETTTATVYTFTTPSNVAYIRFNGNMASVDEIMLNLGSEAFPYEPWGVKIPISSANTTTPIYLGEVESTRWIKKSVLTGEENFNTDTYLRFSIFIGDIKTSTSRTGRSYCSHYECLYHAEPYDNDWNNVYYQSGGTLYFHDRRFDTVTAFKSYLAAQYAAGTPVCVWYVLATEETGIVNEPLRKIGDYADTVSGITIPTIAGANTISVGTTLQPSEVSVNYKGWHPVQSVHERESGQWD